MLLPRFRKKKILPHCLLKWQKVGKKREKKAHLKQFSSPGMLRNICPRGLIKRLTACYQSKSPFSQMRLFPREPLLSREASSNGELSKDTEVDG